MEKSEIIRIFNVIDDNIWAEKADTNPMLSTFIVFSIAILGACVSSGRALNEWFHWNVGLPYHTAAATGIFLYGFLLAESIITTKKLTAAITRSLFYFGVCFVAYWAGYILAFVVLFAIVIYLMFLIITSAFGMMIDDMTHAGSSSSSSSSSSSGEHTTIEEVKLEDGTILTKKGYDDWRDEHGHAWDEKGNDRFEKRY